jgi:tripartite-type tricarboxylate transporter receptor subunit TctC
MGKSINLRTSSAFAALMAGALWASFAGAQDLSKMTISVGFTSGGTYDATARLFARHYAKHLTGNPQIIVQNMPGSGGVVALNHLYNIAPRDGSALALVDGALAFEALFGNPAVKYDPRQLNWIGSRAKETPVLERAPSISRGCSMRCSARSSRLSQVIRAATSSPSRWSAVKPKAGAAGRGQA